MDEATKAAHERKLTFEQYKAMANMFVIHLRREEARVEAGETEGIRRTDLIQWYLSETQDIQTESELVEKKILCDKVIDRLILKDGVLIALKSPKSIQNEQDEDPILVVHPDYSTEEY